MRKLSAVIQAGGKGTRLAPYSTVLPKALMPIGEDGAVIDGLLEMFSKVGVINVFITVSKFSGLIRSYCGDGSRWGVDIEYVMETEPLGTIGPLAPLRDRLTDTFFVSNSDVWSDLDLRAFLTAHREGASLLTVATVEQSIQIAYGVLDAVGGRVIGFREKPTERYRVSTGVYCMEREILDMVPPGVPFGFDQLMHRLLEDGHRVTSYNHPGQWIDIGRVEDLRRAQEQAVVPGPQKAEPRSEEKVEVPRPVASHG